MAEERSAIGQTEPDRTGGAVFPARLKALRERRGLDRKTLAELCGLSKNMISQYERGEKEPSLRTLTVIADFFGVSLDHLVGRE